MSESNSFRCKCCKFNQPFSIEIFVVEVLNPPSYSNSTVFLTGVEKYEAITSFGPSFYEQCRRCKTINVRNVQYANVVFENEETVRNVYKNFGYPPTIKTRIDNSMRSTNSFRCTRKPFWLPTNKIVRRVKLSDKVSTETKHPSLSQDPLERKPLEIESLVEEEDIYT